mgnify:CR=1 FL=1
MVDIRKMRFKISSDVVFHKIGEGVFIYHTQHGTCFGLEGVGMEIWQMICDGKAVDEIIKTICRDYDIHEGKVNRDVESFVNRLLSNKLLESIQ